jgi:hypothetical protein
VAALVADPRYRIGDEDAARAVSDSALGRERGAGLLFGRSSHQLRSPRMPSTRLRGSSPSTPPTTTVAPRRVHGRSAAGPAQPGQRTVVHRWFKQLPLSDAQRLPGSSHPSGHVTLTQARHPIDQAIYFRHTFFGSAAWRRLARGRERATITAHVSIMGRSRGRLSLEVDHNPAFGAGQRNRVSTLRWGAISDYLRTQVNVAGQWLTLEAMSDGTYRLVVAASPVGPFIP